MKITEYDISNPFTATVTKSERITDDNTDEVRHINLRIHHPSFQFIEGQSIGVLVEAPPVFGNENYLRLYSIASSRLGEADDAAEISLCVRRCFFIDGVNGERYPGIVSNYLCNAQPGDTIKLTGPFGRHFMPPRDSSCNLIMIGVGTGIAPFRAFLKYIYGERQEWTGKIRLFYGAKTGMDLLYLNDKNDDISTYYDEATFKAFEALSPRPHFDEPADMHSTIADNAAEAWDLMQDPKTHVYISGLSKLEEDLDKVFSVAAGTPEVWETVKAEMTEAGRWSTLFYG